MSNLQHLNATDLDDEFKSSQKVDETLGIDGKYQWPIRIFTPVFFVASLLVVQLAGSNGNR